MFILYNINNCKEVYKHVNDRIELVHKVVVIVKPILIILVLGFAYLFIYQKFNVGIPCLINKLTGYKCPGCGMTHAMAAIWNQNFKDAWEYNPLSVTVLPIMCIYLLYRWIKENLHKRERFAVWEYILLTILIVIVLAYGYIRNK